MKRDKETYPKIKTIKPLFWKECRFCNKEFKREQGFEIEDCTAVNPRLYISYCCDECAENIDEVKELVKKSKIIKPPRGISAEKSYSDTLDDDALPQNTTHYMG